MQCEPRLPFWLITVLALVFNRMAIAHPLSQGSIDVRVEAKSVSVRARVTVEEVAITNEATTPGAQPGPWATQAPTAFEQHAAYLASHLRIFSDGVALAGGVVSVKPPDSVDPLINASADYDLIYALPVGHTPKLIQIQDDVLTDGNFAPGATWDATYVVKISVPGGPSSEGMLLTRTNPVKFDCVASAAGESSQVSKGSLFKAYLYHGIHHILTGYDHLLFVSALVLAATTLWDLVKVVSAFTLAHTITL
ncbi:MAG TPA: HupE/UreJ family protein, partial [Tepidisphaeraceae bacterium]|nr:HupE/UreJ family protein [Tepidisphaeraceae bacterium]